MFLFFAFARERIFIKMHIIDSRSATGWKNILFADDDDVELHVLGCRLTCQGQTATNAEAWFNVALCPQKP